MRPQKIGRQNIATKARNFPARPAGKPGRTASIPITAALNKTRNTIKVVAWGMDSYPSLAQAACCAAFCVSLKLFLCERSNVSYQILDLIGLHAFPVCRHLALTVRGDGSEFGVAHLLDRRGTPILGLQRCLSLPVGAVAGYALGFERCCPCLRIGLRVRTEQNQTCKA